MSIEGLGLLTTLAGLLLAIYTVVRASRGSKPVTTEEATRIAMEYAALFAGSPSRGIVWVRPEDSGNGLRVFLVETVDYLVSVTVDEFGEVNCAKRETPEQRPGILLTLVQTVRTALSAWREAA